MTYLFLGEDGEQKESTISEIKEKILADKDARNFDYEVLYATNLDPSTLKKTLITLPAVAKKRLILIHACEKLNPHNQELILEFVSSHQEYADLLLESSTLNSNDSFVKKLKPFVNMISSAGQEKSNVFDMTRAMTMRRQPEALKILSSLLEEGAHPLQIMGGMVWFWGKCKQRVSRDKFEEGLRVLSQADLNIKRSRLSPDYAIELVVVKLCGILG
jgi:DNA polymerase III delta subunit